MITFGTVARKSDLGGGGGGVGRMGFRLRYKADGLAALTF